MVGFGLGAQLGGCIGRATQERSNGALKLVRITGLDPTSSGFEQPTSNSNYLPPLSITDAVFTDVIHTDAGFRGVESDLVKADFWPNFGHRHQPGCEASNAFNNESAKNGLSSHSIHKTRMKNYFLFRFMQPQTCIPILGRKCDIGKQRRVFGSRSQKFHLFPERRLEFVSHSYNGSELFIRVSVLVVQN